MKKNQEKIRNKRRKATAEDFTPPELINEMLDKLPEEVWEGDKTFCDPACGNGNMIIEILKRRLKLFSPLKALSTIYGCDIMKDNIRELRERIYNLIPKANMREEEIKEVIRYLLNHFLYTPDALKFNFCFPRKASNENIELFYHNHLIFSPETCIIEPYKVSANDTANQSENTEREKEENWGRLYSLYACQRNPW